MNIPTLTNNQKLVAGAVLSLAVSAGSTALTAIEQAYTAQHTLNVGVLIIVGLTTFGSVFGAALYNYVPGHAMAEIAAIRDTVEDVRIALQTGAPIPSGASLPLTSGTVRIPAIKLPPSPIDLRPGNGTPPPTRGNTPPSNG
jgi:hypothetical protein